MLSDCRPKMKIKNHAVKCAVLPVVSECSNLH